MSLQPRKKTRTLKRFSIPFNRLFAWSEKIEVFCAHLEFQKKSNRRKLSNFAAILIFNATTLPLAAKPLGHSVKHGQVHVQTKGNTTHITASDKAIIDWKSFNIDKHESVFFNQGGTLSTVLNRVTSIQASHINGLLEASGHVYLINPYGIVIGKHGQINAHAFTASTLQLDQRSFLDEHELQFSGDSYKNLENHGIIQCTKNVYLISSSITNKGTISSEKGSVFLASAHIAHIDHDLIKIQWNNQEGTIINTGDISAIAIEIHAHGGNPYALAINNRGTLQANSLHRENGRIYLRAIEGKIENAGSLSAPQGRIEIFAPIIAIEAQSTLDVSDPSNPGKIYIGGSFPGNHHKKLEASTVSIQKNAQLKACATNQGSGGEVIIYSTSHTNFQGTILATGIGNQTSGGFVEVSSKTSVNFDGFVDISSAGGYIGTLLRQPGQTNRESHSLKRYWSLDPHPKRPGKHGEY